MLTLLTYCSAVIRSLRSLFPLSWLNFDTRSFTSSKNEGGVCQFRDWTETDSCRQSAFSCRYMEYWLRFWRISIAFVVSTRLGMACLDEHLLTPKHTVKVKLKNFVAMLLLLVVGYTVTWLFCSVHSSIPEGLSSWEDLKTNMKKQK